LKKPKVLPQIVISFTITHMQPSAPLSRPFFARPALHVARELLGMRLVRLEDGERTSGVVIETEAYSSEQDLGCHCRAGRTPRTQVMYGPPGHAYIYFTYGMHWMLNFVVEAKGFPAAVLIRSIQHSEGLATIASRRGGQPPAQWTNGPAKICQAFNIDKKFSGVDLCAPDAVLFVEPGNPFPDSCVTVSPRVGLNNVPEPWKSIPWRFYIRDKAHGLKDKDNL